MLCKFGGEQEVTIVLYEKNKFKMAESLVAREWVLTLSSIQLFIPNQQLKKRIILLSLTVREL